MEDAIDLNGILQSDVPLTCIDAQEDNGEKQQNMIVDEEPISYVPTGVTACQSGATSGTATPRKDQSTTKSSGSSESTPKKTTSTNVLGALKSPASGQSLKSPKVSCLILSIAPTYFHF